MYEADGLVRVNFIMGAIAKVVWIVRLVWMADLVMKLMRGSIVNIAGKTSVYQATTWSQTRWTIYDSGELHTKTGI